MATPNFDALVTDVRNWANRDMEALPDSIIEDAISYAADDSYHRLMIPPLESTFTYDAIEQSDITNTNGISTIELAVPSDLVQFIHLRTTGTNGCVFNEKTDVRTFHDMNADKYFGNYWTRQGNNILVAGALTAGDTFELFYYRRLPAADAVYRFNQSNIDTGVVNHVSVDPEDTDAVLASTLSLRFPNGGSYSITEDNIDAGLVSVVMTAGTDTDDFVYTEITAENQVRMADTIGEFYRRNRIASTGWWVPDEIPHWLKDENRKILLFGALSYCGKYLMDDMLVQYHERQYIAEIDSVNAEEKARRASGGNVQMHFNGRGLI